MDIDNKARQLDRRSPLLNGQSELVGRQGRKLCPMFESVCFGACHKCALSMVRSLEHLWYSVKAESIGGNSYG